MLFLLSLAAVGWRRRSNAAWSGRPQPELPQQAPWPNSCLPRQRPAAGKWTHSVLVCLPVFSHRFSSHSACWWHCHCPGACWLLHAWVTLFSTVLVFFTSHFHHFPCSSSSLIYPVSSLWWLACPLLVRSLWWRSSRDRTAWWDLQ